MNVYDASRMADVLRGDGYVSSDDVNAAEIVILNTCHIREKAAEKVYSDIGRIVKNRKIGNRQILAVGGCVGQAHGEEIIRRAPDVNIVFGPQTYHQLPEMISYVKKNKSTVVDTEFPLNSKFDSLPKRNQENAFTAFLSIQEGCDKFCSFCVVPYTRGAEYSRPVLQIITEAMNLVSDGVREITLLGQNVNNYRGRTKTGMELGLGGLIKELSNINGLERVRYTTSYPADMSDELIDAHRDVEILMPFLHLPMQSGSNKILSSMNRRHTVEDYLTLVEKLREARPEIALSSDFIVGFPGETEKDFESTMQVVEKLNFAQAYSFKYSKRPGTPAAKFNSQVPEALKIERLSILQKLLNSKQLKFNQSWIGKSLPVLLDRVGRHDGQLLGRSPFLQSVHSFLPVDLLGKIIDLNINSAQQNSLSGERAANLPFC